MFSIVAIIQFFGALVLDYFEFFAWPIDICATRTYDLKGRFVRKAENACFNGSGLVVNPEAKTAVVIF